MKNSDNDNKDPFTSIGAFAARVLMRQSLPNENSDGGADADCQDVRGQNAAADRNYVDQRLRELRAFEARARGIGLRPLRK